VITPRICKFARAALGGAGASAALSRQGFAFPLLLRSPGFHTGRHFVLAESAGELSRLADTLPGDDLLVISYLDARGRDGQVRKYRVMFVDGRLYPLHLAISPNWKVHYFTADMANTAHRAEDAAFLADMPKVLGQKAMAALDRIRRTLGLDYGGIDFGLNVEGDVLLFEANATMVVNPPDADARFAYRVPAVTRILDAVKAMLVERAHARHSHACAQADG
jgi:glutathione synthase/RimK-type ligase-like ATP-grasp enzyme